MTTSPEQSVYVLEPILICKNVMSASTPKTLGVCSAMFLPAQQCKQCVSSLCLTHAMQQRLWNSLTARQRDSIYARRVRLLFLLFFYLQCVVASSSEGDTFSAIAASLTITNGVHDGSPTKVYRRKVETMWAGHIHFCSLSSFSSRGIFISFLAICFSNFSKPVPSHPHVSSLQPGYVHAVQHASSSAARCFGRASLQKRHDDMNLLTSI